MTKPLEKQATDNTLIRYVDTDSRHRSSDVVHCLEIHKGGIPTVGEADQPVYEDDYTHVLRLKTHERLSRRLVEEHHVGVLKIGIRIPRTLANLVERNVGQQEGW